MSDLISRQDAIEAIRKLSQDDGYINLPHEHVTDAVRGLPSVQPGPEEFEWCHDCKEYDQTAHCCHRAQKVIQQVVEELKAERKMGKWIVDALANNIYRCSECGIDAPVEPTGGTEYKSNYCPNCGADMRGDEDE